MKLNLILNLIIFFVASSVVPCISALCNQTCGGRRLPFPFGFTSGCEIQLNCSSNGTILAAEFPVQSVTSDTLMITVPAACGRPVEALERMFTSKYAPTSQNAVLLHNCSSTSSSCFLPTTMVQANFEMVDCDAKNNSTSCYSEEGHRNPFMNYSNLMRSNCRSLFSAISMEHLANGSSFSMDVQIVRLGWWIPGGCRCDENAKCVEVSPPVEGHPPGYRCRCEEGFVGDGFQDGLGCRKESLGCNPSKYLDGRCGGTTRIGVLVGGLAAGACLMIGLGLVFCFIRKRSKLRTRTRKSRRFCKTAGITIPVYTYKDMEKATDFFSDNRMLGNGAYGTVYSGKLPNDEWVAIKRLKRRDSDSTEQVINEIKLLSSVSHPNLVRLLGCSIEKEEQILVYEFMPNGTLSQHLLRQKGNGLPWPVRLAIATETAHAISYLHNAMHPPIYHRDVKSSNILLDNEYRSKVADFGLSRLGMTESSHISTAPQGTPGYVDPEYHQHFHLSDKSDVYSFGVVLIEMVTALRAVDFNRPQNEVNLAALAVDRIGRGRLDDIVDPFLELHGDAWTVSSVRRVAELAFRCLAFHRDMRPSMMEVGIELEQIRLIEFTKLESSMIGSSVASSSSSGSSSSILSEKPLRRQEVQSVGLVSSTASFDEVTDFSPESVQDSWRSDRSPASSSSLLNHFERSNNSFQISN